MQPGLKLGKQGAIQGILSTELHAKCRVTCKNEPLRPRCMEVETFLLTAVGHSKHGRKGGVAAQTVIF